MAKQTPYARAGDVHTGNDKVVRECVSFGALARFKGTQRVICPSLGATSTTTTSTTTTTATATPFLPSLLLLLLLLVMLSLLDSELGCLPRVWLEVKREALEVVLDVFGAMENGIVAQHLHIARVLLKVRLHSHQRQTRDSELVKACECE